MGLQSREQIFDIHLRGKRASRNENDEHDDGKQCFSFLCKYIHSRKDWRDADVHAVTPFYSTESSLSMLVESYGFLCLILKQSLKSCTTQSHPRRRQLVCER